MPTTQLEKALPKPPTIEMYSGKYFLACGLGGIVGTYLPNLPPSNPAL